MIHLHVHYRLILGQRYIKNHHLSIEETVLGELTMKDEVFIPVPELELIMLIIRAHMKVDVPSLIKQCIRDLMCTPYTPFPAHIEEELDDLISKIDIKRLKDILAQINLPLKDELFTEFIERYSGRTIHVHKVILDCCTIFSALKGFRRRTSPDMYLEYCRRAFWDLPGMNRFRPLKRKTLPGRGVMIALVGADGSGKSTLIEDLEKWISWKLSVRRVYYGIPKTKIVKILQRLIYGLEKFNFKGIASLLDGLLWIHVARTRYMISLQAKDESAAGKIVISDRFPLREFHTMAQPMDGPRLRDRSTRWRYLLSSLESRYYKSIRIPDRIFVLKVDLDEIRKRKSDLDLDTHRMKVDAVNNLADTDVITVVDAGRPYEEVQLELKRLIWNDLIRNR